MLTESVSGEALPRHSYTYDAEGRTATRTSSGVTEGYIYDHAGQLVKKTSASGDTVYIAGIYERKLTTPAVVTKYYYGGGNRIAKLGLKWLC